MRGGCGFQSLAIEIRTRVAQGVKHFVRIGIKHHAEYAFAMVHERDRDTEIAFAIGKIAGAIKRIDTPEPFRVAPDFSLFNDRHFFAQDGAIK